METDEWDPLEVVSLVAGETWKTWPADVWPQCVAE